MNRKWTFTFTLILIFSTTLACRFTTPSTLRQELIADIRIKNETGQYIDEFWLGSRGRSMGDIEIDELTNYKSAGTHPAGYASNSMHSNGKTYANVLLPSIFEEIEPGKLKVMFLLDLDNSGEPTLIEELEPGKYTFTLRLDSEGEPTLSVFRDE